MSTKNVDVFCHIWDHNSSSAKLGIDAVEQVSESEMQDLLDALNPTDYVIEGPIAFEKRSESQAVDHPAHLSQFYGMMVASSLRRQHEMKKGFMYDVVIRSRYDLFLDDNVSIPSEINPNTVHGYGLTMKGNYLFEISDLFWMSDSITYDIVTNMFFACEEIDQKWFSGSSYGPEHVLFHHIKNNRVLVKNHNWTIKILRPNKESSVNAYDIW